MKILLELLGTFARIGLFTFGGGYAMLPLIGDICVERKGWITHDELADITVIAESTPGPIAINCATYVGMKRKGIPGAVAATVGVILPSFLILLLISFFLESFLEIRWVASAFRGIKLAVGVLIVHAAVRMIVRMKKKSLLSILLLIGAFLAVFLIDLFAWRLSTVILMLFSAAVCLVVFLIRQRKERGAKK